MAEIDHANLSAVPGSLTFVRQNFPYLSPDMVCHRRRRPLEKKSSLLHHQNIICNVRHIRDDMGGQDHDFVSGKVRDQIPEAHPFFRVKPRRRLIQNQDIGIVQFRLRDSQALLHPSRIGFDFSVGHIPQIDQFQQLLRSIFCGFSLHSLDRGQIHQKLTGGKIRIKAKILRHIAQMGVILFPQFLHGCSIQADAAGCGFQNPADHSHQGRLSRTVRAEQAIYPGRKTDAHLVHRTLGSVLLTQTL